MLGVGSMLTRLANDRMEQIECVTWDLLQEVCFGEIIVPPVDLNRIATFLQLVICQGDFSDDQIAGAYDRVSKTIYVSEGISIVSKDFTVAHEIGHFLLHASRLKETFYRKDMSLIGGENCIQEQEANWFAACLLMPRWVVTQLWLATRDVTDVACRCGVFSLAAHYRLKNLGLLG